MALSPLDAADHAHTRCDAYVVGCVVGRDRRGEVAAVSEWVSATSCGQVSGRRTDRISERDLEVLEFVARFGVVPRRVISFWAGTGRAVTAAREKRLREAGLIEVWPGIGTSGRIVVCTRDGLRAVCREALPVPRPSLASLVHASAAAYVAVQLEHDGQRVLSEREIVARERSEGRRIYSADHAGRFHRPDLIVLGDPPEAIEVELSDKSNRRLDEILRAWRRAIARKQFSRVRYFCSPRALPHVERACNRTRFIVGISVEAVPITDGFAVVS